MQLPDLVEALKTKVNMEEKYYGHHCNDDDIMWIWKELLSERAVHLLRREVELAKEEKQLADDQEADLQIIKKRLENFGEKITIIR